MRLLDIPPCLDYNLYCGSLVMDAVTGNVGNMSYYFTALWITGPMKLTDC